jgi:Asp/Glu/hydantoin racemase
MGIEGRCAGDRAIGLRVADLAAADARDRIEETALALRDHDGADVLVLGCAGMAHARARLQEATGLPVIDPCQAGAAMALSQIALGLTHAQEPDNAR